MNQPAKQNSALSEAEKLDWLRLSRTENVGPITFYRLVERYGSAREALEALPELSRRGGRKKPLKAPPESTVQKEYEALRDLGGDIVTARGIERDRQRCTSAARKRANGHATVGHICAAQTNLACAHALIAHGCRILGQQARQRQRPAVEITLAIGKDNIDVQQLRGCVDCVLGKGNARRKASEDWRVICRQNSYRYHVATKCRVLKCGERAIRSA